MSRVRVVLALVTGPRDAWLATRALGWLVVLPLLKRVVSLSRLVRLMWLTPRPNSRDLAGEEQTIRIVARLSRVSGGNCLERSLVLYRYLARANADPRLVVGMARPDEYLGHVWVTVDDRPLLELAETLERYNVVTRFEAGGRRAV